MWPLGRFIHNSFLNSLTNDVKLAASFRGASASAAAAAVNRLLRHVAVEM